MISLMVCRRPASARLQQRAPRSSWLFWGTSDHGMLIRLARTSKHESGASPEAPTSVPAVWSLVLGILSMPPFPFSVLTGVPAIFYGRKAIRAIRTGRQPHRGMALAWTGVVLGYTSILITILLVVLIVTGVLRP